VATAVTVFSCTATGPKKNQSDQRPGTGQKKLIESDLDTANSATDYANFCKQELGLPAAPLASWNCLEGREIPVTVDGKIPDTATYAKMKREKSGCDLPSWFSDVPCANYAFVQQRELSPDVTAMLLCRMRGFSSNQTRAERQKKYESSDSASDFKALWEFDSIGLFWTNRKTGRTCYFDYFGASYGGRVPSPDDPKTPTWDELPSPKPPADYQTDKKLQTYWQRSADEIWKKPAEVAAEDNCIRCHDSGPFKASPWIGQVIQVPANPKDVPHIVVGEVFSEWKKRFPMIAVSTDPVTNDKGKYEPQSCTSCHRIGSLATCKEYLGFSVGKGSPVETSEWGRTFFYRTWMPPPPDSWHTKTESELTDLWNQKYAKHVERMTCCCENPQAKGCYTQRFDTEPVENPRPGTGPAVCD
jgi:hypothetical protein